MANHYTIEKNTQMLISLMKAHGIKRVIISPGMKNMSFAGSLQCDPFFELYSCVDERSAAYMACGMAVESGEPVALSCTGATASRNYIPALTEAYYRKLPVLAVTSMSHSGEIGQLCPQVIDRRSQLNDIVNLSVQIPMIESERDEWSCNVLLNTALLALKRRGGGPVHINLITEHTKDFSATKLPNTRVIDRITADDKLPSLPRRVGIFVGAHKKWDNELTAAVERFCEAYNGVVLCDHTSNYHGKYGIQASLMSKAESKRFTTLLHIGEISGSYFSFNPESVWRISPDGEIRDAFRKLRYVFEMEELDFFRRYNEVTDAAPNTNFYEEWITERRRLLEMVPELPFSNGWLASVILPRLPPNSILYLGILNSLRMWNFFDAPDGVTVYSNTGGFGIDGTLSSALGTALVDPGRICTVVLGDLSFFYDMNAIGNRHLPSNLRILLVNNGMGAEFRNYGHPSELVFGKDADPYIAAAGHFGNRSPLLVRHYAEDLGFEYFAAKEKGDVLGIVDQFTSAENRERPMLMEAFIEPENEKIALGLLRTVGDPAGTAMKQGIKDILGENNVWKLRKVLNR